MNDDFAGRYGLKDISDPSLPQYVKNAAKRWKGTAAYVTTNPGYQLLTVEDARTFIANSQALDTES